MFLQACVCAHGGGVCLSACWDTTPPGSRHPPGGDTPLGADTPLKQTPPEQTLPQSRHPPPEQTWPPKSRPPGADTPPPPGETATAADGTHPTRMHSCFSCGFRQILYPKQGYHMPHKRRNILLFYRKMILIPLLFSGNAFHFSCFTPFENNNFSYVDRLNV